MHYKKIFRIEWDGDDQPFLAECIKNELEQAIINGNFKITEINTKSQADVICELLKKAKER